MVKDKEQREISKQQKEQLQDFTKRQDILGLVTKYRKSLQHIFKHFAKQDDIELNSAIAIKINTINIAKFKKFCAVFRIVPDILPAEDMVSLFKQSTAYKMPPVAELSPTSVIEKDIQSLDYDVQN